MDKDVRDYLDQRLLIFTTKDDVEKLRQEMRANLLRFKEETKNQINESLNEIKSGLKDLDLKMILEEMGKGFEKWQRDINLNLRSKLDEMDNNILQLEKDRANIIEQFHKEIDPRFERIKTEIIDIIKDEVTLFVKSIKDELSSNTKSTEPLMRDVRKEIEYAQDQVKRISDEIKTFYDNIVNAVKDMRNDISSMLKISYRDFEKRLEELEQRIKAIEKIVFP